MVETSSRGMAVVGTGLVGGSIALGLKARGHRERIVGYDRDRDALRRARERGAIDVAVGVPEDAVRDADVVVLAVPVDRIPAACARLAGAVRRDAVVTDVGSAKGAVVRAGGRGFGGRFVGGHPMAGSERHGIEAADPDLFVDAWWMLTPTSETSPTAYATVSALVQALGARPVAVDPEAHDALVARLSHVPQLTASALVASAVAESDGDAPQWLAARGFRDVTRIAASDPELWVAIIRSNRAAVAGALERLRDTLESVARAVEDERWGELESFLERARAARLERFAKPRGPDEPVAVVVLIPDRPGVLAEVTTAASELGVNIEDLRLVHSTEGGRGRLELVVDGTAAAEALSGALCARGYRPTIVAVDVSTDP
jgi:prephenate dehydrogenase